MHEFNLDMAFSVDLETSKIFKRARVEDNFVVCGIMTIRLVVYFIASFLISFSMLSIITMI